MQNFASSRHILPFLEYLNGLSFRLYTNKFWSFWYVCTFILYAENLGLVGLIFFISWNLFSFLFLQVSVNVKEKLTAAKEEVSLKFNMMKLTTVSFDLHSKTNKFVVCPLICPGCKDLCHCVMMLQILFITTWGI